MVVQLSEVGRSGAVVDGVLALSSAIAAVDLILKQWVNSTSQPPALPPGGGDTVVEVAGPEVDASLDLQHSTAHT